MKMFALLCLGLLASCSCQNRALNVGQAAHDQISSAVKRQREPSLVVSLDMSFLHAMCSSISLNKVPLTEAAIEIRKAVSANDDGIPSLMVSPDAEDKGPVTLNLKKVSFGELLRYVTSITGTRAVFWPELNLIIIEPRYSCVDSEGLPLYNSRK